jgi:hypothetical protein
MRIRTLSVVVPVLIATTISGCAITAHVRGVAGDEAEERPPPTASINVSSDPNGIPWDENPEITRKIERLLSRKGYTVANSTDAEYYLFFEFDRDSLMNRIRFEPFSGFESGIHTTREEGPFDLSLSLRLVRADAYRETGMGTYVWAGGAILREAPTESPKFTDMLLVAAMRAFPYDTGKTLVERLRLSDSEVRKLHEH